MSDQRQGTGGRPLRVLHVGLRVGGGLLGAIHDYIGNTPALEHHVLVRWEPGFQIGADLEQAASSLVELPAGLSDQARAIRRRVEELRPDLVHAHSSFAGALVRGFLPAAWRSRVVYTPHCFSFYRRDVSLPVRAAYWLVEALLAYRGAVTAACSPAEARAAERLRPGAAVTYVPNVAPSVPATPSPPPRVDGSGLVVAVGRVSPQKDPGLFAAAAEESRRRGLDLRWRWIGGGNPRLEDQLRAAGVEVTGWRTRHAGLEELSAADVYVHTAAWEGAPLTVLESAAAGVPVLGRRTVALEALGLAPLWSSVGELVDMLTDLHTNPAVAGAAASTAALRERHTVERQRQALLRTYAGVLGNDSAWSWDDAVLGGTPSDDGPRPLSTLSASRAEGKAADHRA